MQKRYKEHVQNFPIFDCAVRPDTTIAFRCPAIAHMCSRRGHSDSVCNWLLTKKNALKKKPPEL
uniref:Uncharacterized protein n=1 Tax=Salix viminalis TaxID=40686 RepID=A0A6N2KSB6_SALVM